MPATQSQPPAPLPQTPEPQAAVKSVAPAPSVTGQHVTLQASELTWVSARDAAGTQIPYGAVLYDPSGDTWAFVNVEGRSFVRQPITVDHIEGDNAFLKEGPAVGAKVVTVGGAEIYGAELGVGDDE